MTEYIEEVRKFYHRADDFSRGTLSIIKGSFLGFSEARATEGAASLAYYALFSFFPLLIFLVGFVSAYLEDETLRNFIFESIENNLPAYFQDLVKGNIEQALNARGRIQILGIIGLLWAASGVFTGLTHNIDRAWHNAERRNFIFGRLVGLGIIAAITTGMLILWLLSTAIFNILPALEIHLWNGQSIQIYNTMLWSSLARIIPWLLVFLTFLNLYRWVPNTTVRWWEAAWGAAIAALGWEFAQRGFSWYLTSGWARYQLVYGSLGAVIAFILWLYVSALIVLYGAHLSASIAFHTRLKHEDSETERQPVLENQA